jgi:hypothetical protein
MNSHHPLGLQNSAYRSTPKKINYELQMGNKKNFERFSSTDY